MPRFKATFRDLNTGRNRQQIITGKDCYAVKKTITNRFPSASGLTIAAMPNGEKLRNYEVAIARCGDPSVRRMQAASPMELHWRIEDAQPNARILRISEVTRIRN